MDVSLQDACRLLGKTPRQVRYAIKKGEMNGHKVAGRWVVDAAALPLSAGQVRAREAKDEQLRDVVDKALGPSSGRRYGVRDLTAFTGGVRVFRTLAPGPGQDAVSGGLVALAQGYHRFHDRDKLESYRLAREEMARAAALLLSASPESEAVAETIEHEVIPAIHGLIRRCERRKP